MKTLIGFLALAASTTAFAGDCYLNNANGEHFVLSSQAVDTGAPYGIVSVGRDGGRRYLSLTSMGETKIIFFRKYLSITESVTDASKGNLVCD